jgi:vacuolar-type H+-ATPase subunit H
MSDDFLTRIQKTEDEAKKLIIKAQEKFQQDVQNEKQKLIKLRDKKREDARTKSKERLSMKQKEMRKVYDTLVTDGKKTAASLENECKPKQEKILPTAFSYLLNELI